MNSTLYTLISPSLERFGPYDARTLVVWYRIGLLDGFECEASVGARFTAEHLIGSLPVPAIVEEKVSALEVSDGPFDPCPPEKQATIAAEKLPFSDLPIFELLADLAIDAYRNPGAYVDGDETAVEGTGEAPLPVVAPVAEPVTPEPPTPAPVAPAVEKPEKTPPPPASAPASVPAPVKAVASTAKSTASLPEAAANIFMEGEVADDDEDEPYDPIKKVESRGPALTIALVVGFVAIAAAVAAFVLLNDKDTEPVDLPAATPVAPAVFMEEAESPSSELPTPETQPGPEPIETPPPAEETASIEEPEITPPAVGNSPAETATAEAEAEAPEPVAQEASDVTAQTHSEATEDTTPPEVMAPELSTEENPETTEGDSAEKDGE